MPNDLLPAGTRLIEFIRPDPTKRLSRMTLGALPMVLGSVLLSRAYLGLSALDPMRLSRSVDSLTPVAQTQMMPGLATSLEGNLVLFALGFLLIIAGPLGVIFWLRRMWREEELVMVRSDALLVLTGDKGVELPWDEVLHVTFRGGRTQRTDMGKVVCELRDDSEFVLPPQFHQGDSRALAARLELIRRRASFGML